MIPLDHGLLAAVLESPQDDMPRLVLADWLEENGDDARSSFIRLQVRIATIQATCSCGSCVRLRGGGQCTNGPCGVDQERDELPDGRSRQAFLRMRQNELLHAHGWDWSAELASLLRCYDWTIDGGMNGDEDKKWVWRRGFVESVTLPADSWLSHADAALACHPITSVRLISLPEMRLRRSGGASGWQLYGNLRGREWPIPTIATDLERVAVALAAEWPGIEFVLPED